MELDKPGDHDRHRTKLANVLNEVKVQSHLLAEHATIIFTRSEMALDEVVEANLPLRTHLKAIHDSARTIAGSSKKLRELVAR